MSMQEWLARRGPISDYARQCRWCSTGQGDPVDDCACDRDRECEWRGCGSHYLRLLNEGDRAAVVAEMEQEIRKIRKIRKILGLPKGEA